MILQKQDFKSLAQDGGNTRRNQENSAKKRGRSASLMLQPNSHWHSCYDYCNTANWLTNENDGTDPVLHAQQVLTVAAAENWPSNEEQGIHGTHHCIKLFNTHRNTLVEFMFWLEKKINATVISFSKTKYQVNCQHQRTILLVLTSVLSSNISDYPVHCVPKKRKPPNVWQ